MMDYASLRAVAAVAREGSFEKAAKILGVTPSAVSQRVKLLEERIGAILIVRGQPCRATPEGELVCRHVEQVSMLEDGLSRRLPAIPGAQEAGRLTIPIVVNADSLATWFIEAAASFSRRTGYLLDISVDDQEHTAEWLRAARAVGAVTAHGEPVQGFRSLHLGSMRYHAAASPDFAVRHFPHGVTAAALRAAPALVFDRKDRLQEQWVAKAAGGEAVSFPIHWIPSAHAFIEASLAGMGWGMSPSRLLERHFAEGALVDLSPEHVVDVPLYWQVRGIALGQLKDLTDAIVSTARLRLSRP